ncbi:MAG: CPBP family intramembrane metalloprotease [Anaerolineales bacterium]|nr:CPBP family intramembrane metalloprotease [Anaerolineales bacterium]
MWRNEAKIKSAHRHGRDRAEALLKNRLVITIELILVVTLQIFQAIGWTSAALAYLFFIGWLSLWLRRNGWRQLGLNRPTSWLGAIGAGAVVGLVCQAVSIGLIVPGLSRLTHRPLDLGQFAALHESVPQLILWLTTSWTIGAFGEELVYRGYLLNRVADLFKVRQAGWIMGLIGSSALFGLGHAYQGIPGIFETFLFGCGMAGLYLAGRRNIWLPVIAHGVYDTVALVLIFLGLVP